MHGFMAGRRTTRETPSRKAPRRGLELGRDPGSEAREIDEIDEIDETALTASRNRRRRTGPREHRAEEGRRRAEHVRMRVEEDLFATHKELDVGRFPFPSSARQEGPASESAGSSGGSSSTIAGVRLSRRSSVRSARRGAQGPRFAEIRNSDSDSAVSSGPPGARVASGDAPRASARQHSRAIHSHTGAARRTASGRPCAHAPASKAHRGLRPGVLRRRLRQPRGDRGQSLGGRDDVDGRVDGRVDGALRRVDAVRHPDERARERPRDALEQRPAVQGPGRLAP